jgi:hypothetical protein
VAEIEARRETEGFHLDLRYFCDGDDSTARLPLWMLDGRREWKHDLSKHEETVQ